MSCFLFCLFGSDVYHNIEALDPEKLNVFRTVREITGSVDFVLVLDVYHNIEALDPEKLNVFRTVREITGKTLELAFSFSAVKQ
ncbi:receptor tyrosine-protein kinase erbB-4-like [Tachysurus ichikawai]